VYRLAYSDNIVAFKMGRRQGGPSRALLFKDSMSGTEEPVKLTDSHTNKYMHGPIKIPTAAR
jgi:hypothetical protein